MSKAQNDTKEKRTEIKHIFCDLDGALFGQNLRISPRVKKAVNSLPNDMGFSIATARAQSEAFPILEGLRLKGPQIL